MLLLRRWLRGERIRAPHRSQLGVSSPIESPSQMLNALEGLLKFLRLPDTAETSEQAKCRGLLFFLDEFELIWKARRDRRDQFLQALRALIDSSPWGLFLCVGMATGIHVEMEEVEASYPALFARLKGSRGIPALVQIGFVTEAIGYARAFERHARSKYAQAFGNSGLQEDIFTDHDIESFFTDLAGRGSVSQGDFFDRLHTEAERRVRNESADNESP
jgi:bacteriophage exclusion system BrxC/D-like protein